MRIRRSILLSGSIAFLVVLGVVAYVLVQTDEERSDTLAPTAGRADASFVVTSPETASRRLKTIAETSRETTSTLTVDANDPKQEWWGTGAALTDASVRLLTKAPEAVDLLFDPNGKSGARLDALRLPLTSTDLSSRAWTWGWDGQQASPSPEAGAAITAITMKIKPLQSDLRVAVAPWSAPPSMKTSRTLRGGGLKQDAETSYAAMLAAQTRALRERGVPVAAASLVNEPSHSSDYPTMTLSVEQMARLADRVGPKLPGGVSLWAGDDNWNKRSAFDRLVKASSSFDGSAYHCYEGSPETMDGPTRFRIVTECTGTDDGWKRSFSWQMRQLVTEPVARGSSGLLMWSLALDPEHGPKDPTSRWGCQNCRGLVTIDGKKVSPGPEFYVLAHLTRAAPAGSHAVPVKSDDPQVSAAAFRREDGSVGVVGVNQAGEDKVVAIRVGDTTRRYEVAAGELFTQVEPG